MEIILSLLSLIIQSFWTILQILFLVVWIVISKKVKISGQKNALFGFILLFVTMLFNIFQLDIIAGKFAEFVWILFAISFVQQFYHFLKYENK